MSYLRKTTLRALALTMFVGITAESSAQIYYGYDAAGNRTSKSITLSKTLKKMAKPETDEMFENEAFAIDFDEPQIDVVDKREIKIYPNPTKGVLRVDIPEVDNGNIAIYDLKGTLICSVFNLTKSNNIDLSDVANGIYIMQITIGAETTTWQIVKE